MQLRKLICDKGVHTCGRTSPPLRFVGQDDDARPHAWVRHSLGNHLIKTEGQYEWTDEYKEVPDPVAPRDAEDPQEEDDAPVPKRGKTVRLEAVIGNNAGG